MAITRITKGVIKPNENYDTHNIVSTGIITSVGADINGDLDVDGHTNLDNVSISGVTTFAGSVSNLVLSGVVTTTGLDVNGNADISGNLSVGGVLTYEDVTSIDSIGIITARNDIHVGAGVSAVGVGTFGSLDIGGDIDVDGHTELDNLNVAGITTFNDNVHLKTNDRLRIGNSNELEIYQQGNNTFILNNDDTFVIGQQGSGANHAMRIYGGSTLELKHMYGNGGQQFLLNSVRGAQTEIYNAGVKKFETSSTGITVTGTVVATGADINGDIDVDGHTNLDNVSIAGVTTTTGHIYIDADNRRLFVGADNDISIYNDGSNSRIENASGQLIVKSPTFTVQSSNSNQIISRDLAEVDLYYNGVKKFSTASSGINVVGTTTSTQLAIAGVSTFTGAIDANGDLDVDGHTNLDNVSIAGVTTHSDDVTFTTANGNNILFDKSANKLLFGNGIIAEFGLGGSDGLLRIKSDAGGNSYITEQGAGNLTIQSTGNGVFFQKAGTSEYLATMKTDGEVELYHNGNQKLETTNTGITVTGSLVATSNIEAHNIEAQGAFKLGNGNYAIFGASNGMFIYHTGTLGFIDNNVGTLKILSDSLKVRNNAEDHDYIVCNNQTSVDLYYDNSKKFETTSTGISVTGGAVLTSTDTGSSAGPELKLFRNSASPADADYLGQIKFAGESDTGVERNYAKITGKILDASNGTEDGILEFAHIKAGSQVITGRWRSDSLQLLNGTALTVAGSTTVTGNIIPSSDSATDIGTNGVRFANIYADTLYGDGSNLTGVTSVGGNTGVDFNDSVKARFGTGNDLEIFHDGSHTYIENNSSGGQLRFIQQGSSSIIFRANVGGGDITQQVGWDIDGSGNWVPNMDSMQQIGYTNKRPNKIYADNFYGDGSNLTGITSVGGNTGVDFNDNVKARFGTGNDLEIFHNSVHTMIQNATGSLWIKTTNAGHIYLYTDNSHGIYLEGNDGHVIPSSDSAIDLGLTGTRFRNVYADTLYGDGSNLTGISISSDAQYNTVAGNASGDSITSGTFNSTFGDNAGTNITSGGFNTVVGSYALRNVSTQSNTTAIGAGALNNSTGSNNTIIGAVAGNQIVGSDNTGVGYKAIYGAGNSSGTKNIAIGNYTLEDLESGNYNTVVGYEAGKEITTGSNSTAIGFEAASSITSGKTTAVGYRASKSLTTGIWGVAVGMEAMLNATQADSCVAIGAKCLEALTTGDENTAVGARSLYLATIAEENVAMGYDAGYAVTSGTGNTILGYKSGNSLTTGDNNIVIGHEAAASSATVDNEITLGDTNITKFRIPGINVTLKDNGGTPTQGHVLTVDGNGEAGFAAASGTTINNNADNRVITGSGSANTLNGESNFTYNGTSCTLKGATDGVLNLDTTDNRGSFIRFQLNGTSKVWVGCGQGLSLGDQDDLGLRATDNIIMRAGSGEKLRIDSNGQVLPGTDDSQNLGSSTKRWANIYAADMHFSNKGKTNDVDGTWGDWTLQEGEDSVYMINNRTGKKYAITMKEVN